MLKVRSPIYKKEKFNFGVVLVAINIIVSILSIFVAVVLSLLMLSHQIDVIQKSAADVQLESRA